MRQQNSGNKSRYNKSHSHIEVKHEMGENLDDLCNQERADVKRIKYLLGKINLPPPRHRSDLHKCIYDEFTTKHPLEYVVRSLIEYIIIEPSKLLRKCSSVADVSLFSTSKPVIPINLLANNIQPVTRSLLESPEFCDINNIPKIKKEPIKELTMKDLKHNKQTSTVIDMLNNYNARRDNKIKQPENIERAIKQTESTNKTKEPKKPEDKHGSKPSNTITFNTKSKPVSYSQLNPHWGDSGMDDENKLVQSLNVRDLKSTANTPLTKTIIYKSPHNSPQRSTNPSPKKVFAANSKKDANDKQFIGKKTGRDKNQSSEVNVKEIVKLAKNFIKKKGELRLLIGNKVDEIEKVYNLYLENRKAISIYI
jgi:hypothetical protein